MISFLPHGFAPLDVIVEFVYLRSGLFTLGIQSEGEGDRV
jgi:hypothetical protein